MTAEQTNKQTNKQTNNPDELTGIYLNGVQLTKRQADEFEQVLDKMVEAREAELRKLLPNYQTEIHQLPRIFQIRIEALKEVNPKKFANSPELILSSLAAAYLIRTLPLKKLVSIPKDKYEEAHSRYGLSFGDVNPYLVSELFWGYIHDIQNGAIDKDGNLLDINKSKVMTVFHSWRENGIPMDAKETVAKYSVPRSELLKTLSKQVFPNSK